MKTTTLSFLLQLAFVFAAQAGPTNGCNSLFVSAQSFSSLALGDNAPQVFKLTNGCATLPAALTYFTATRIKNSVSLQWQTMDEQDSKGFNLLRKTNGGWEIIAFIATKAPNGSSSTKLSYEYTDGNSFGGVSEYQLAAVSTENWQKLSEIKAVRGESQTAKVTVFPNPSGDGKVTLVFEKDVPRNLVVSDMSGRIVKQFDGVTGSSLIVENLQAGFYAVRITEGPNNEAYTEKVVVNNR